MRPISLHDFDKLWQRVKCWCLKAGREGSRPVLLLWFVMRSPATPFRDKASIFMSIVSLVAPFRFLRLRRLSLLGLVEPVLSIAAAIRKMNRHITPEIRIEANAQLDRWFGGKNGAILQEVEKNI